MVLWLKPWESRSLPGLPRTDNPQRHDLNTPKNAASQKGRGVFARGKKEDDALLVFGEPSRGVIAARLRQSSEDELMRVVSSDGLAAMNCKVNFS